MNAKQLTALVGRTGQLQSPRMPFTVDVSIIDARMTYGAVHVQVQPVAGQGDGWIALSSVTLDPEVDNG